MKKIKYMKIINLIIIFMFILTYLLGFFDICEELVFKYPDDGTMYEDYGLNAYTRILWYMFLPFSLSIIQYGLVRCADVKGKKICNILLTIAQLALVGVALFKVISIKVDYFGFGFTAAVNIRLMSVTVIGLLVIIAICLMVNAILSIMLMKKCDDSIETSQYNDRCFAYIPPVVALCISLVTASNAESWRFEHWGMHFYLIVIGIPFALFGVIVIRMLMKQRCYIYAICAYILYLITTNGVIYHINQRQTSGDYREMTLVNTVVVLATIVWLVFKHIRLKSQIGNQWKVLVGLIVFLALFVPFYRDYEDKGVNYVYRTPIYSATYETDNGINDYIGEVFSLKIFGIEVYRNTQEVQVLD